MPPSRRRPVQPATRVRLPRSPRAASAPSADAVAPVAAPVAETELDDVTQDSDLPTGDDPDGFDVTGDEDGPDSPAVSVADAAEVAEVAEVADGEELPAEKTAAVAAERNPMLLPAILGALTVTLGSLAIWFGVAASSTGNGVDTQSTALTDTSATAQVNQQIDKAFSTVFSYNYADTGKTLNAARALLTGKAVGQYESLFKVVEQEAPKEKLVLTTTVTSSGVETLSGNTARVLIFADQKDTSASHQTTDAGAMLAINAVRVDGQWKISSIDTFSSGG